MPALYSALPEVYQIESGDRELGDLLDSLRTSRASMVRLSDSIWSWYSGVASTYNAVYYAGMNAAYNGKLWATPFDVDTSVGQPMSQCRLLGAANVALDVGVVARGATCQYPCPIISAAGANNARRIPHDSTANYMMGRYNYSAPATPAYAQYVGGQAFRTDNGSKIRVHCVTYAESAAGLNCLFTPDANTTTGGESTLVTVAGTGPALNTAAWDVVSIDAEVTAAQWTTRATKPFPNWLIQANEENKFAAMLGARFLNRDTDACGLVPDNYAAPGYTAASYMGHHGACWPAISKISQNARIVDICFGANEAGSTSLADYKAAIMALIAAMRSACGNDLFFILHAQTCRNDLAGTQTVYDGYAGELYDLAASDRRIRFCNDRLSMERLGWTIANHATWSADFVHPNPVGAAQLAELHIRQLFTRLGQRSRVALSTGGFRR